MVDAAAERSRASILSVEWKPASVMDTAEEFSRGGGWSGGNEVGTALLDPGLTDEAHKDPEREFPPNLALLSFPATTKYLLFCSHNAEYFFLLSQEFRSICP